MSLAPHTAKIKVLACLATGSIALGLLERPSVSMAQAVEAAAEPAKPPIDEQRVRAAFDQLAAAASSGKWSARWDPTTRLPRMLRHGASRVYPGTASDAAEAFLQEHKALFAADRPEIALQVARVTHAIADIKSVAIDQKYRGLPVVNGSMTVAIDGENRVRAVTSTVWPLAPDLSTEPALTHAQAIERAQVAMPGSEGAWDAPMLAIYPRGGGVLCYLLSRKLSDDHVLAWELAIDARTGETIEARDVIQQHSHDDDDEHKATRAPRPSSARQAVGGGSGDDDDGGIAGGAPSPCERTWELNGPVGQTMVSAAPPPGPADPYKVVIELGTSNFGAPEDGTQAEAIYGAGIKLLPGIHYTISFAWSLHTWDSYNEAFGYWDVFFVHCNSEGFYWSHPFGLPEHISANVCSTVYNPWHEDMWGPVWSFGGDEHSDEALCSSSGSFSFEYYEPNQDKTVYLSAGLDTAATGAVDGYMPSWGAIALEITGETMILNPNPVTAMGGMPAPPMSDMGNSNSAVPAILYEAVELTDLATPSGDAPWKLEGDYAKLTDKPTPVLAPPAAPLTPETYTPPASHNGIFAYLRGCKEFEAVMAYHHVTQNQLYIQSLGFTSVNDRQIEIDAHSFTERNAFYMPAPLGAGYLAFGDGMVDSAEDGDVIIHEYGHSIQDNQAPGKYLGSTVHPSGINESRSMGEGFSDYWACSYFRPQNEASGFDPWQWAEWWWYIPPPAGPGMRKVANSYKYPRDIFPGSIHNTGQIWSGMLWDIQMALGREDADRLVLTSHYFVEAAPSFADAAEALLLADALLSGGHEVGLANGIADRGIFRRLTVESALSGAEITVSEDDVLGVGGGTAPFMRIHRHGQALTLTAAAWNQGYPFRHWLLDGSVATTSHALSLTMNDPSPPALQLTRTARAVYHKPGDVTGDGIVNVADLLAVISAWGACPAPCDADVNGDGIVNVADLLLVISNWG